MFPFVETTQRLLGKSERTVTFPSRLRLSVKLTTSTPAPEHTTYPAISSLKRLRCRGSFEQESKHHRVSSCTPTVRHRTTRYTFTSGGWRAVPTRSRCWWSITSTGHKRLTWEYARMNRPLEGTGAFVRIAVSKTENKKCMWPRRGIHERTN